MERKAKKEKEKMSPNNKTSDDKVKEIKDLSDKLTIGGIAKKVGVSRPTVKKYINESSDKLEYGL